ncbi:MAG: hypothetical protein HOM58_20130 [Rhodospirillaceae bacterium]|nr:hypothetical protein [Rhodospirillaceae bacterium]MBT5455588.1 hypothetical protein [Rhodospirillaceae bacterium]
MKKILIGIVVVLVVVGGGVAYVFLNAGGIIKQVVEEVGSEATQAKVTLSSVDLSIQSGEAALNGFQLANPQGFKTPKAMSFGGVSVKIDTSTVTSDVIVIKEVVISKPEITYEFADGGSNFDAIQKNVDAYAKSMGAGGGDKKQDSAEAKGSKKVIIENLYVRDGKIGVSASFLKGKEMNAALPTIHLKDIGKKKNGATAAEVADQLLGEISKSATKVVSSLGVGKMMDAAKGAMKDAEKMLKEGGGGDATKMLDGATKGVGDSLKGLFGK